MLGTSDKHVKCVAISISLARFLRFICTRRSLLRFVTTTTTTTTMMTMTKSRICYALYVYITTIRYSVLPRWLSPFLLSPKSSSQSWPLNVQLFTCEMSICPMIKYHTDKLIFEIAIMQIGWARNDFVQILNFNAPILN